MRIITGEFRGRRLRSPRWAGLRPTSDRLRETLFNVLGDRVAGARVLDVCAGTGAVGLEALSRGARFAVFVERDPRAVALIRDNAARCGAGARYAIEHAPAARVLAVRVRGGPFDIAVLDPPYDEADLARLVEGAGAQLVPDGVVVLEHARRRPPPEAAGRWRRTRTIEAGDSALSFYRAGQVVATDAEADR